MDLNVRVIKAVECCPTLYKGHASIEERQLVWQQLSEQMRVPETVLKTRWHLLCGYYQRCLEKRRSTDEDKNIEAGGDGTAPRNNDFRYETEMAFMMPYIHARIAIAAANAARKQQELQQAGVNNLTEPEFVITEKDIELATAVSNQISQDYAFYEVETYEQQQQNEEVEEEYNDSGGGGDGDITETSQEGEFIEGDVIEHIDESGNIVMQDIIYEASEDGGEIEIEENEAEAEEILQMAEQIEVQTEQVIEEMVADEVHDEDENDYITERYSITMVEPMEEEENHTKKFLKISDIKTIPQENVKPSNTETILPFNQEYSIMTRRRPAVVLKATPRVQVELTDNSSAATNIVLQEQQSQQESQQQLKSIQKEETLEMSTDEITIEEQQPIQINIEKQNIEKTNETTSSTTQAQSIDDTNSKVKTNEDNNSNDNSNKNERSEDTIFGELVTAMLKQMPPERKRTIKKSIMDLLLT